MSYRTDDRSRDRQLLDEIIDHEIRFERRVRRGAIAAWSATFAMLPLAGIALFVIETGGGLAVDALRAALVVLGIAGILTLFGAVLMTVAWLSRSRAPTLAVIERRLAALETILLSRA